MSDTLDRLQPDLRLPARLMSAALGRQRSVENLRRPPGAVNRVISEVARRRVPKTLRVHEESVPRADGSRLRLLVIRPRRPRRDVPGLLWLHGGGYLTGEPEQGIGIVRSFVEGSGCVVVAPAYRLSVDAPYPAARDDAYAALLWLRDHADELGVRRDQLAVGGNSAGGGLTAATTLYARDRGEVSVAFQMPLYPMIDDRTPVDVLDDAPVWDAVTNRNAWSMYLGDLDGTDDVPAYAAPARCTDHTGLPPTMTFVGDVDPFHEETTRYVEALRAAGVPVEFRVVEGAFHGFDVIASSARATREAVAFRDQWFGHAVRAYRAPQPPGAQ